jgi:tetratricopeptide (TPR) repeat protein
MESADHIYGERPAAVSQGIALMLSGKPDEAIKLLEPVVALHRPSAKIPGNFWVEAARATLIAYALDGKNPKAEAIGRDITEATPAQGSDPFVLLGKSLGLPASTKPEERIASLKDLTTDDQPAAVAAYATFFIAKAYKDSNRNAEALESFLTVTGVYPTGGIVLNAAAELNAADILSGLTRREEALALVNSASRNAPGTVLADEAKRRLDSLK